MFRPTCFLALAATFSLVSAEPVTGWLNWRGPLQTGVSLEKNLPAKWTPGGENHLWTYPVQGGGAPVAANGKLFVFGYVGHSGEEVRETVLCLDASTGEKVWEYRFSDFLSDVVYERYGIGSPVIDPETGNVYVQSSNGRCLAFTADGEKLWEISLMEKLGRLTFPNGRTGSAAIDDHLVIFHCVTANWGTDGPGRDRFYAFDKLNGDLVWFSTPGEQPVDSSFAMPVFGELDGHRVFYAGLGCGNVACVDARTGKPLWRFPFSAGGVNSQVLAFGPSRVIAIHGNENLDSSTKGRLVCLNIPTTYPEEQVVLGKEAEVWRNDTPVAFTSSPILVENKIYLTGATGELHCIDANSGETLWTNKVGPDQIHASPTYGDGKLYVPFFSGVFEILAPAQEGSEVLQQTMIKDGEAIVPLLAAPSIYAGKVYLQTKSALHCFGDAERNFPAEAVLNSPKPEPVGEIASLQVVPAEFALSPGETQEFRVWGLDSKGRRVKEVTEGLSWEKFVPPTARVKSEVDAELDAATGKLTAAPDAKLSAGALKVTASGFSATTRGRVEAAYGYAEDFEGFELDQERADGTKFAYPPLPWLGARIKWSVIEKDGNKVITNNLDNVLFQRTMNFFGPTEMSDYILEAEVMTDGNRRILSNVGLVNQRYHIVLAGNQQILEVSSNHERLKESVPFEIKAGQWYHLKTNVVRNEDGSGTVRAKAWVKGSDEPEGWTIEVPVKYAHEMGAPAIFAFSPQSLKPVYIDNLKLTKN